jgi:chorismate dehydratase
MIRISAVSYLNTLPFIYGIENSGFINVSEYILTRDIPSLCARKLETKEADLVLTPIAAIANLKNIKIETDYCIGAKRHVNSVLLVGQKPMDQITHVYLDNQSRTSVTLVKVLAEKFWKKKFHWLEAIPDYEKNITENTGGVIIGDRALILSESFKYKYDLACEWNDFTGLPFVFACWVSRNNISSDFMFRFNKALAWGIEHINEIKPDYPYLSNEFIRNYYNNNIDYPLNSKKRESMELFFSYMKTMSFI